MLVVTVGYILTTITGVNLSLEGLNNVGENILLRLLSNLVSSEDRELQSQRFLYCYYLKAIEYDSDFTSDYFSKIV